MAAPHESAGEGERWRRRSYANITLAALARKFLDESGSDIRAAAEKFMALMDAEPAVYRAALDRFKEQAAYDVIRLALRHTRQSIQHTTRARGNAGDALITAIERNWYDWPLASGMSLGAANRDDLVAQARIHELQELGNGHKKRWLLALANEMPARGCVRHSVREDVIARMYEETKSC
jgi:hypothetical protein